MISLPQACPAPPPLQYSHDYPPPTPPSCEAARTFLCHNIKISALLHLQCLPFQDPMSSCPQNPQPLELKMAGSSKQFFSDIIFVALKIPSENSLRFGGRHHIVVLRLPNAWSNGNLEMLVFEEKGKPKYPEKNLSEQGREPTTNSAHIWR